MRAIDADYVLGEIGKYAMHPNEELVNNLAIAFDIVCDAPTIGAVEVVRCKDCKHGGRRNDADIECKKHKLIMRLKDYCSYGERKETDHE